MSEFDLLSIGRGAVTAPAGCGKTHLIAMTLTHHSDPKPILVLTHTNAGVAALRDRLNRAHVPPRAYRLSTIDGWAMQLTSMFPKRSGHDPAVLELKNPPRDYLKIREAAATLLEKGHIGDILTATYSRIVVDEYQDCSVRQHAIVTQVAETLPTCVLGDPLQAIFDFGGDELVKWKDVCAFFPVVHELTTPWRWINQGSEPLGRWLLEVRSKLLCGKAIDIRKAPRAVTWVHLDGSEDYRRLLNAAWVRPSTATGTVLIIGDSVNSEGRRKLASQVGGAVTVEAVELRDLIAFARAFDVQAPDALERLAKFAQKVMTNVGAQELIRRVEILAKGTARKPPSDVESTALTFVKSPSHRMAAQLLQQIAAESGRRTYRPTVLRACINALQLSDQIDGLSFHDATIRIREQYRIAGRKLPLRAVGSTLLLKGLECDTAVVLNACDLDARNLYVAITRAARSLTICSPTPVLTPPK